MVTIKVTEDLLQFIFQYKLFNPNCETIDQKPISILNVGQKNYGEGPDFLSAKIKIDNLIIAGNIEIDLLSSNWKKHGHDKNKNYQNIILHVVWEYDVTPNHKSIPVLEIKNFIPKILIQKFETLMASTHAILCHDFILQEKADALVLNMWQSALIVERLQHKTETIKKYLSLTENNWEQVFFIMLMKNFGYTANEMLFEDVALKTDIKVFAKNKNNLESIIALLFGQAQLFDTPQTDDFIDKLKEEYTYLKHKYSLKHSLFKVQYGKMRPVNFPSIRLAQMASLIYKSSNLFSKILETKEIKKCIEFFEIEIHPYFKNHFSLGKISTINSNKKLGDEFVRNILINTLIPIIFIYGEINQKEHYKTRALDWLETLPAENNTITRLWNELQINFSTASESQSMIELYKNYCVQKRCLYCKIAYKIFST